MFFIMQKLKPEIETAILKEAERLFSTDGFKKATMRHIADAVGIRVSNLYLYFKNKEVLFNRIVSPFHREFDSNIKMFFKHKDDKESLRNKMDALVQIFTTVIRENQKLFVILFDKSEGTKFENFREKVSQFLAGHIEHEIEEDFDPKILLLITDNLLNGFVHTAKTSRSEEQIKRNLSLILRYHVNGISDFINH